MPRDIPVGNGSLLVTFDQNYQIRDFYFPHVGKENHSAGHVFHFGIWLDGEMSWIDNPDWVRHLRYVPETLVTDVLLINQRLAIRITSQDTVDYDSNIYLRRLIVENLAERPRDIRIFFHQDFYIRETDVGDTAFFDPETRSVIHYKGNRYFLCGLAADAAGAISYATGKKGLSGAEGTWRDAEDGILGGNPISQGAVDSIIGAKLTLAGCEETTLHYWIAVGKNYNDVFKLHESIVRDGPDRLIHETESYWRTWVNKQELNFGNLPLDIIDHFKRSLLIVRTQIDNGGAIIAANDSDISQFSRDTYSYMWPRDGALVAYGLDLAGYSSLARRFFTFCQDLIKEEGFYLHKYTPEGNLASSWHPWYTGAERQLPIQEDETALVVWSMWNHYDQTRDIEFCAELYRTVITRAADFMVDYRDVEPGGTNLPLPSWDLWEERRGVMTFTCAAVWAGLRAASKFAKLFGDTARAARYRTAAAEVKAGIIKHLYLPELGRFARMIVPLPDALSSSVIREVDSTIDASLFAVFYFGVFSPDDPMVVSTMKAIEERLWAKTEVGGVARYENDYYHQVSQDVANVAGNPWFICTLWLAQYRIARAWTLEELESSLEILEWVISHSLPSGVLAEQVNPYTNQPLSVSPLTWSHATVIATVVEYLIKLEKLVVCDNCGRSMFRLDRHGREIVQLVED